MYWDSDATSAASRITTGAGLGGSGAWDASAARWYNGSANVPWVNGSDAVFWGTAGTVTLSAAQSVNSLVFKSGYLITASTLTLAGPSITVDAGVTATLKSAIAGSLGLIKNGPGTLALAAVNSYSGGTIINAGVLGIVSNALGAIPTSPVLNVTINNGATLRFDITGLTVAVNRRILLGTGGGQIDTNGNNVTLAGVISGSSLTKTGSGLLALTNANTYSGATTVNAGTLQITQSFRSGASLTVAGAAKAVLTRRSGAVKTLQVATLSLSPDAALDLNDNDLVVDHGDFTTLRQLVLSGFANTTGITSSTSNGSQILALFDNALIGASAWNGATIGANAIVGKYTYFGDVNFDGQVTGDDYTIIDSNLNTTPLAGLAWLSGDANLDGIVTGDDYTAIDSNLGLGSGNPLSPSALAVPEPARALALMALPMALSCRRRRRARNVKE
jgi:fibronectin-binding autotransporter adhesin